MQQYEIMLVIDGRLTEKDAEQVYGKMLSLLKGAKNVEETKKGLQPMAYRIQGTNQAYYYIINFDLQDRAVLDEFRKIALITKGVLRHLIVNIYNNYGYRASINPKKIKRSQVAFAKYEERKKHFEKEREMKRAWYASKKDEYNNRSNNRSQSVVEEEKNE